MTETRKPLIAGNWKMNLNHLEAIALVQKLAFSLNREQLEAVEAVVLPPFVDIRSVQTLVDGDKLTIGFGAQDLSAHPSGAYTGEIAGSMLAKLGCSYVAVGHSERRQYHEEGDEMVAAKVRRRLDNGITPDPVRRRGAGRPRGGQPHRALGQPARSPRSTASPRKAREGRAWPTSPSGPSARAAGGHAGDAQEVIGACARRWPRSIGAVADAGPDPVRRFGEVLATSPRSWRSRTSTAPLSEARASTPRSSPRSFASPSTWGRKQVCPRRRKAPQVSCRAAAQRCAAAPCVS